MIAEYKFAEQNKTPEQFLSKEEIRSIFEIILKGKPYKELRFQADEKGVLLYEIEVVAENGEKMEFNFQRAKYDYTNPSLPAGGRFSASIHATIFDASGMPYNGMCVANYLDGKWVAV